MNQTDTIVAISSPPGRSLRGLIRLSGDGVDPILEKLGVALPPPHTLTRARIDALPVLVLRFKQPLSYTGQDLAEIQLPGNPALLDRLLHRMIDFGARMAEPGEFTARAFLAGKMDLPQAEGVAAAIAAVSDSQLAAATLLRQGKLGSFASEMVDQLADALALVEAGIDFTDQEDVVPIEPLELLDRLTNLRQHLADVLAHSRSWGAIEVLPRVVLVGVPSSGKSTLFNALLGRQRTVVSAEPGTTRDIIVEPLRLPGDGPGNPGNSGVEVLLIDIAGLDTPESALDHAVQQQARTAIASADLILQLGGAAQHYSSPAIHIHAKCDLEQAIAHSDISVSAHTGHNLDALRRLIAQRIGDRAVSVSSQMLALQPRHESALRTALAHITEAICLLESQRNGHAILHVELVAASCRAALDQLAALGGQMTPDDVIGRVFSRFCIGK